MSECVSEWRTKRVNMAAEVRASNKRKEDDGRKKMRRRSAEWASGTKMVLNERGL
jgi:hypothetical protein